jgi:hypothetical protein
LLEQSGVCEVGWLSDLLCGFGECRALGAAKSALGDRRGALQVLNAANRLQPNDMWTLRLVSSLLPLEAISLFGEMIVLVV